MLYKCPRQDRSRLLDSVFYEALYVPYLKKVGGDGVVVMNAYGVHAAKLLGKKVVVDLMDLWSCEDSALHLNAVDFKSLKKADLVLAWSRAIHSLLRRMGISSVYLPFGVDLKTFDPMSVPPSLFLNRYPDVGGTVRLVYSGGLWYVGGKEVLGVGKLLKAFKKVEEKRRDVALLIQAPREVMEMAREMGLRNVVHVERTPLSNDPLRLSFLRSADILVLTGSRYPAVYLAERTTMYQYMATGNAILAEATLGVRGVLTHGETGYLVELDNPGKMAEAILVLAADEGLRRYIGRNARSLLERHYTWEKLIEKARSILA